MDSEGKEGQTLSHQFDVIYEEFYKIINFEESTSSEIFQKRIQSSISKLEDLTKEVSAVDMFTKNEHFQNMNPSELKFLLLPFMLGSLWLLRMGPDRAQCCIISQAYFHDFVKRCVEYELIERKDEDDDKDEKEEEEPLKDKKIKKKKTLSPEEKRNKKIKKLKENKELDLKIDSYRARCNNTNEEPDDFILQELFVSLLRRSLNEADDQLESIEMELELIKFGAEAEKNRKEGRTTESEQQKSSSAPKSKPLKPFIITKDDVQKKVYGVGYPSLPVMTVEELYEQRRATGEWGPPPPAGGVQNPEINQEELDAVVKERDQDDDGTIARQRDYDEYKDDHRRGWGNRFNRS